MNTLSPGMLEKRTSGGGVCVGGVVAYGRSQPADSTQHTAHRSGVDVKCCDMARTMVIRLAIMLAKLLGCV